MLYQKDFKQSYMEREGFGGRITIATSRANAAERYVIKLQKHTQSLKEYVAQKLIAALGFYSIPAEWYQDDYGDVYGALKFLDGLNPVGLKNSSDLTVEQKEKMLFHLTLSFILGNADGGEVFLVNTDSADGGSAAAEICSLDYGEALCGKSMFSATLEEEVTERLKIVTEVSQKHMTITDDFGKAEIERACSETVRRLAGLNMTKLDSTLSDIAKYFGKRVAEWYWQYFMDLKAACANLC